MMPSGPTYDEQKADTSSVGTGIVMLGSVLIGLLLLTTVVAFIMTVYQVPHLGRLRDANVLVQIFANLVVAFYAFPAFTRTKRRAFLALGFAALIFAYAAIFNVLASVALAQTSRSQAQWYYTTIYVPILLHYFCTLMALFHWHDQPKPLITSRLNQTKEPTALSLSAKPMKITLRFAIVAVIFSTMLLSSGCEEKTVATDPSAQSTPGSTKPLEAAGLVGYDGKKLRKSVDRIKEGNEKHNQELGKMAEGGPDQ